MPQTSVTDAISLTESDRRQPVDGFSWKMGRGDLFLWGIYVGKAKFPQYRTRFR